jgi:hypothetical protein
VYIRATHVISRTIHDGLTGGAVERTNGQNEGI